MGEVVIEAVVEVEDVTAVVIVFCLIVVAFVPLPGDGRGCDVIRDKSDFLPSKTRDLYTFRCYC